MSHLRLYQHLILIAAENLNSIININHTVSHLCFPGPVVSVLAEKFGSRRVTIAGSVIACVGFLLSTQATSIEMLIVTWGVIGGIHFQPDVSLCVCLCVCALMGWVFVCVCVCVCVRAC